MRDVWWSGLGRNRSRRAGSLLVVNQCEIEGGGDVPRSASCGSPLLLSRLVRGRTIG